MRRDVSWWYERGMRAVRHPLLFSQRIGYNIKRFSCDQLNRFGYYAYPHRIIFIAGLPLSGTTWVKNLFARVPGYFTRPAPMPDDVRYRQDICDSAFRHVPHFGNTLFKTHLNPTEANIDCISRHGVEKVLVVYRDLRDVIVSHYNRLLVFPKPKGAYDYVDIDVVGKEGLMDYCINNAAGECVDWIRGWHAFAKRYPGRCHFIRYEELKADTTKEFKKALEFYGICMSERDIDQAVDMSRGRGNVKKNMEAAKICPWGYASNFRSGKVGGWRRDLSDSQKTKCKALLGTALIELGYEGDLNW
jgi:hypothetical protein